MCHCAWTDFEELSPIHGPYDISYIVKRDIQSLVQECIGIWN